MVTSRVLALAFTLLAVAGCARDDGGGQSEAERKRSVEEELSRMPELAPGETSPPPAITSGWEKTDFSKRAVPLTEFESGGPGKDGIPSIDSPKFIPVAETRFLEPKEPVIALELSGKARAYPLQILVWHEIVNDVVAGTPVAVTFCPLCHTAIVFDRRVDGKTLEFGTTGNLRNSDLVMYDRQTESWWQQFAGRALAGDLTGAKLEQLPARILAWRDFQQEHPGGSVLSRQTGYPDRPYGENPYPGYDDAESSPFFAARNSDDKRLPAKERVVFIERGADAVAVAFSTLRTRNLVRVEVGGHRLLVRWRAGVSSALDRSSLAEGRDVGTVEVLEDGRLVPFDQPFWFAVAAFRPGVRVVN
jgi:hypothetical protein